jgi:hypothetical protein
MRDVFETQMTRMASGLIALVLVLAACSGGPGSSPAADQGGASAASGGGSAASSDTSGGGGTGGDATVTGSVTSTGAYDGTWTWQAGNEAGPGIIGVTVTSDKGDFGSISVLDDGSITFTSGASALTAGSYKGTGAQVTSKNNAPCGFTLDNDVTGGGQTVHLKGTMTIEGGAFC